MKTEQYIPKKLDWITTAGRNRREQDHLAWIFSTVAGQIPDDSTHGITYPNATNVEKEAYIHTPQGRTITLSKMIPPEGVQPVAVTISGIVPKNHFTIITTDQAGRHSLTFSVNHDLWSFKPGDAVYSNNRLLREPSARVVRRDLERRLTPNTKSKTKIPA